MRALLIATLLLLSPAAFADEPAPASSRFSVELGVDTAYVTDPAFDLAGSMDVFAGPSAAVGWAPGWLDGRLSLRLGYGWARAETRTFQTWDASLDRHQLDLGASMRLLDWSHGALFARAGVLVDLASLAIADSQLKLSSMAVTPGALAAVGHELLWPIGSRGTAIGVLVEAGYGLRFMDARFALRPDGADVAKDERIEIKPVDAGAVSLSSPFWRLALVLRM